MGLFKIRTLTLGLLQILTDHGHLLGSLIN